jgi:hypothetical protein
MQNVGPKTDLALLCGGVTWAFSVFTVVVAPKEWEVVMMVAGLLFLGLPLVFSIWSVYIFLKSL